MTFYCSLRCQFPSYFISYIIIFIRLFYLFWRWVCLARQYGPCTETMLRCPRDQCNWRWQRRRRDARNRRMSDNNIPSLEIPRYRYTAVFRGVIVWNSFSKISRSIQTLIETCLLYCYLYVVSAVCCNINIGKRHDSPTMENSHAITKKVALHSWRLSVVV